MMALDLLGDPLVEHITPILKWAGGKRWLVPHLQPIWDQHQHRRLVEPFCGGLSVVLGLSPTSALLNDANPHLVNFYRHVQRGLAYEPSWRGWPDQVRVAEWATQHPGPVVASNQATDRIVDLYQRLGFDLTFLDAPRRINCTGDRTPAREVLATRNIGAAR
jgi:site-specific DNA-adenine methylase